MAPILGNQANLLTVAFFRITETFETPEMTLIEEDGSVFPVVSLNSNGRVIDGETMRHLGDFDGRWYLGELYALQSTLSMIGPHFFTIVRADGVVEVRQYDLLGVMFEFLTPVEDWDYTWNGEENYGVEAKEAERALAKWRAEQVAQEEARRARRARWTRRAGCAVM
jgi:hypothetical protein